MNLTDMQVIIPLLESNGFRFSKAKGQNFLIRQWVPERIVAESGIDSDCAVLEIGPGVGVLTQELCKRASVVAAVELDAALLPVLNTTLSEYDNVHILQGDILKTDIAALVNQYFQGQKPVVCANLPYNVTTPILSKLFECGLFSCITVMIQREVAQRICAAPGTPEYGAFTVFANFYTTPKICFNIPPDCFHPRPKITSTVVRMEAKAAPKNLNDIPLFFSIVRSAFAQRRKTLTNALLPLFGSRLSKEQLSLALSDCSLDTRIRGEALGIPEFIRLTNRFSELLG